MARVVIIGGGFGGLTAAKSLGSVPGVEVILIDRNNHHLFQPLLYQVAMSGLSDAEVAIPIRSVLGRHKNIQVYLDEVLSVDLEEKRVELRDQEPVSYDYLIVSAGARTNYFGKPEWSRYGLGLKDLDDALEIRRRVLLAFEAAERETDEEKRRQLLSFIVIGGGPTGVELAGALAELSRFILSRDFRRARPEETRILLLEAAPRILLGFDEKLAALAVEQLEELGVEVRLGAMVKNIDERGVHLEGELLEAGTVLWTAGVEPRALARNLGAPLDRRGRVIVGEDCSIPGHPDAFVIGDMALFTGKDGKPLPGLAPVAMQQARSVARNIRRSIQGHQRVPFRYRDKGILSTIGRSRAVAEFGNLKFDGMLAWLAWVGVHIWYLIGFRNRFFVMADWLYSYVTYKRGARLITGRRLEPGAPKHVVEPSEVEKAAQRKMAEEAARREAEEREAPRPDGPEPSQPSV